MSNNPAFRIGTSDVRIYSKSFSIEGHMCYQEGDNFQEQLKAALTRLHENAQAEARREIRNALGIRNVGI